MNFFGNPQGALAACAVVFTLGAFSGCANLLSVEEARRLAQAGQHEQALAVLVAARAESPQDNSLRAAELRQREWTIAHLVMQAEMARSGGQAAPLKALMARATAIDAKHPRVVALNDVLARAERVQAIAEQARAAQAAGRLEDAVALGRRWLAEGGDLPVARAFLARAQQALAARTPSAEPLALGAAFRKPLTLEFRDAPLRSVFDGLSRSHGINFVFDREVRGDARITVLLRDVTLAEALRIVLSTHQLASKVLGESTLLIYPNTVPKQREHQELVTRSFFLTNADVKQVQTLIRTLAKTRDMYVDERLNQIVVRDIPEVLAQVERLVAAVDLAEPEVVLDVEVLEISSTRLDEIGIRWPEELQFGLTGLTGQVDVGQRGNFRASIANPAVVATLRESTSRVNTLANPRLRARNREKARVMVGEKLPVFTTSSTAGVGVSVSTAYLDVGLKLEVEPSVQLDNDVIIKVNLDVSTLIGKVTGPQGSVGYQVGTRQASTSLRLHDGETQILAGLIRDEDSKAISGVPGASELPLLGRLFGLHTDQRNKTEIVLLITPRVVRSVEPPVAALTNAPSGVDASPGAEPLRLTGQAAMTVPLATPGRPSPGGVRPNAAAAAAAQEERVATLTLATSGQVEPGGTAVVTLSNASDATVTGELVFDTTALSPAQTGEVRDGRQTFTLGPGAERAFALRVLPAAAGRTLEIALGGVQAVDAGGASRPVQIQGLGQLTVGKP